MYLFAYTVIPKCWRTSLAHHITLRITRFWTFVHYLVFKKYFSNQISFFPHVQGEETLARSVQMERAIHHQMKLRT
jgi:hypothetical protein